MQQRTKAEKTNSDVPLNKSPAISSKKILCDCCRAFILGVLAGALILVLTPQIQSGNADLISRPAEIFSTKNENSTEKKEPKAFSVSFERLSGPDRKSQKQFRQANKHSVLEELLKLDDREASNLFQNNAIHEEVHNLFTESPTAFPVSDDLSLEYFLDNAGANSVSMQNQARKHKSIGDSFFRESGYRENKYFYSP